MPAVTSKNAYRRAKKKAEASKNLTNGDTKIKTIEPNGETEASSPMASALPESEKSTTAVVQPEDFYSAQLDNDHVDGDDLEANIDNDVSEGHPLYDQFKQVIDRFKEANETSSDPTFATPSKPEVFYDDDDNIPDEDQAPIAGGKKRKRQEKMTVAELKAYAAKPDIVEWTDVDSREPKTLVALKSHRNVVPVPNHWSLKREYLSSKRGIEKAAFALPKFIQETGIADMRDAALEKDAQASLKQKQRERVSGKMGKLDIDYSKLYDAFFRFQTKPELTRFGEVYYEGKEYETNMKHLRPGELSEDLKDALGIPPGAPPPWLVQMQRIGPPPSYPALRLPGINAPIPPGCYWGFHPGGWGRPPTDDKGRPLYGGTVTGVFHDQQNSQANAQQTAQTIDFVEPTPYQKTVLWGELEYHEEEEEEEEADSDEEDGEEDEEQDTAPQVEDVREIRTNARSGASTAPFDPTTYGTVPSNLDLRKQQHGGEGEGAAYPRSAGQIIPEQQTHTSGFFGSERTYNLSGVHGNQNRNMPVLGQEENRRKRKAGDVDISVDPDALQRDDKLNKEEMRKQYDAQQGSQFGGKFSVDQEDLSEMIEQESRKRLRKDEENRKRRKG